jgi:F0F1-type ATP synthase alpha subunit
VAIGQKTSTVAEMISGLARTKDMSSVVIVLSGAHEALSQPFFVAEFFTNSPGQYVKLQALVRVVDQQEVMNHPRYRRYDPDDEAIP